MCVSSNEGLQCSERDNLLTFFIFCRRFFGLPVHSSFTSMVQDGTHTQDSASALNSVYPLTEDIELFPGGKIFIFKFFLKKILKQ